MSRIIKSRRALAAVATAVLASGVVAAVPATAAHDQVQAFVVFEQNGVQKSEYQSEVISGCTFCAFGMRVPRKVYGKFLRWCGSDRVDVTIPAGQMTGFSAPCPGGGTWQIRVRVDRTGTHSIDTVVTVVVTLT